MRQIVEYKTLTSNYFNDLDEEINSHIKEGWQPFGASTQNGKAQVIVKYAPEDTVGINMIPSPHLSLKDQAKLDKWIKDPVRRDNKGN